MPPLRAGAPPLELRFLEDEMTQDVAGLESVGLPSEVISRWRAAYAALPSAKEASAGELLRDADLATAFFQVSEELLKRLPLKPKRTAAEQTAAEHLKHGWQEAQLGFLRLHAGHLYSELTQDHRRFVRIEELAETAAQRYPGLVPTRAAVRAEREFRQKDKDGIEVGQGLFFSALLSQTRAGAHLVHAMLRPRLESLELLESFRRTGVAELGTVRCYREGVAGVVEIHNPRFLNAEDDSTTDPLEIAVDLVLLDPSITVGVLRGSILDHPRYRSRRVFNAGINLTHIYHGKVSYLFYPVRELGFVNKIARGHSGEVFWPSDVEMTSEKPWIAAVETFAIGGGCQLLLVMDHVLAEEKAFFNLPARKEGIIPGAANLRLTRAVGDRLARQALLFDRQFPVEAPQTRLLFDRLVPFGQMDAALGQAVTELTGSGLVSISANRKALRVWQEPVELFRQYLAVYCREQAYCHFSPALIRNLEVNWKAQDRVP
jgi:thioesterase DpgC